MSQKFSTFVNMINNKSNIEMQLATYKSMLTKASNDLAKSKQLVGLLKQQIEQGNTELSEELDKANERISMLSEDLSDANARIYVLDTSDAEVNELGLDGLKKKISDAADEALDEKHKDEESKASSAPEQPAVKLPKKTEKEKQKSDSQLPRKRYTTTARVLKSFGIDKSDLPENAKVIIRKGKKDMWVVRLFFYQKQEVYCKEYKIARFNVPGSDPQSSKYPQSIIKGNPLMPSFCRFYLESKLRKHTAKQRRRFRLKYSASIVGKLMKLLKKIKLDSSYGAMVQRAVNYVLDDEKAFKVFLQDGRVEMHNNAVERMFRHLAMGRRNWMHTGSHLGAENIAFMFSLFESCKLNDINFGDYIEDILTRLMEGEQDCMSLIPCNYNSNKKVNVKAA